MCQTKESDDTGKDYADIETARIRMGSKPHVPGYVGYYIPGCTYMAIYHGCSYPTTSYINDQTMDRSHEYI